MRDKELRCRHIHHALGCNAVLRGRTVDELVRAAREHGMREHGFPGQWYDEHLDSLVDVVADRLAGWSRPRPQTYPHL
jgi:hypothetical protein